MGASVVVVEHDLDIIGAADWVIDLGPGPTAVGAEGRPEDVAGGASSLEGTPPRQLAPKPQRAPAAPTCVRPRRATAARAPIRRSSGVTAPSRVPPAIEVEHAREHNLATSPRHPARQARGRHGPERLRQEHARLRRVFAEGQRRFLETLTPYARQFLPTLPRPDVDRVTGRAARRSPSSSAPRAPAREHRRDGDRGRALPAPALRQGRRGPLPHLRRADRRPRPPTSLSPRACEIPGASERSSRPPSSPARAPTSTCSPPRPAPASSGPSPTAR
jgi:hypothetical protein